MQKYGFLPFLRTVIGTWISHLGSKALTHHLLFCVGFFPLRGLHVDILGNNSAITDAVCDSLMHQGNITTNTCVSLPVGSLKPRELAQIMHRAGSIWGLLPLGAAIHPEMTTEIGR